MVGSESLFLAFVCFVFRTLLLFKFVSVIFASYECSGAVRFWENNSDSLVQLNYKADIVSQQL